MSNFQPPDPAYDSRIRESFSRQQAMHSLGITIGRVAPGEVELTMPYSTAFTQQHGYIHAGITTTALDSACGYAGLTLRPVGAEVLTVEFKTNLLAPAQGERFVFRGRVVKPGRTITVADGQAFAVTAAGEKLIATMTGTLMAVYPR